MKRQSKDRVEIPVLTWDVLERAHAIYLEEEPRDAMYRISTKLIKDYWDDIYEVSNALGFLLLTWNSAFYRYGLLNYGLIQDSLVRNKDKLEELRNRSILTCLEEEKFDFKKIYGDFLISLRSIGKKGSDNEGKISFSPVSVGKALHLLCPSFFPLWDNKIALAYGCKWSSNETSFDDYWKFIKVSKIQARNLERSKNRPASLETTEILKLMDEYNYLHFTKKIKIGNIQYFTSMIEIDA